MRPFAWGGRLGLALLVLAMTTALAGSLGCRRRPPVDSAATQARQAERDARVLIRSGTDLAVCDSTLLFGRERYLGQQSTDSRWASRGEHYVVRWAPRCRARIESFWAAHQGCATPIQGREAATFVYWDQTRMAAFQQYGMPEVAQAMAVGRARWQQTCPPDFQAAAAQEPMLAAQMPAPVPVTAVAATATAEVGPTEAQRRLYGAVVFMANGQYDQALVELRALHAATPTAIVTFNIAVCHDQLGQTAEAVAAYQQVASDPTFGPRAQARVAILAGGPPPSVTDQVRETARVEFERGLELAQAGQPAQAIEAFNRSYAAVPHPRTVLNIAVSYHRLGQIDAAISHYQLVVEDPSLEEEMRRTARDAIRELAGQAPSPAPQPPTAVVPPAAR